MRTLFLSLSMIFLLPYFGTCSSSGDTIKKHTSKYFVADPASIDSGLTAYEFYFPQHYISTAVKNGKLTVYDPSSVSGKLVPYSAVDAKALFFYTDSILEFGEDLMTEYYRTVVVEMTGLITDGYQFNEDVYADEKSKSIRIKINGVLLLLNRQQQDLPFYYFVPPADTAVFSYDYLTLRKQADSLALAKMSSEEKEKVNALFTQCVEWSEKGYCRMEQAGNELTKKQAKKLRKSLKKVSLLKDADKILFECDWYFNPETLAFGKQVTKVNIVGGDNRSLFTFLFGK